MNRKELVLSALAHEETRPIPYHLECTGQELENIIEFAGADKAKSLDSCMKYIQYWGWPTEIEPHSGFFKDEFGVVWNRNGIDKDIGAVESVLVKDLDKGGGDEYEFPVCDVARLRIDIEDMLATREDRFTMMGFGFCLFERAWTLLGMENVFYYMAACPDELELFLDRICEYYLNLIDLALEYPLDGLYFGDDWGQMKGLMMGPAHWRRFIKPRLALFYERVKEKGLPVLQHSCGDCHEIFPDLIEIGLDCYQTFQPEIYDIAEMKRLYGKKLTFWGGISVQKALPVMTPTELRQEIIRITDILAVDGGFILAPTHALTSDIPPENVLMMAELFQNQEALFRE